MPGWLFTTLTALAATLAAAGLVVVSALVLPSSVATVIGSVLIPGALIAGALAASSLMDRMRHRQLRRAARAMGLEYRGAMPEDELESLRALPLVRGAPQGFALHWLTGTIGGVPVSVFDFEYSLGAGRYTENRRQTVVVLRTALPRAGERGTAPYVVEGGGGLVALYRPRWICPASALPQLLRRAAELLHARSAG